MSQATPRLSTPPLVTSSRRKFLAQAAAAVAGGAAIGAALPLPGAAVDATSRILTLEKQIFEAYDAAKAYDEDINRCMTIWRDELLRLDAEARSHGVLLAASELMSSVNDGCTAAIAEQNRLTALQDPHYARMDQLVKEMWATPARTSDERRAKVEVLLICIMRDDWRDHDQAADYDIRMARKLLIEFVGGEPADILADQFASEAKQCV